MRKLLAALLTISLNAYAIPPVSVDSEVTAVGNYVQNVKLPNEQATQLTSRNTRVETGNTNLLKNPSFEHMTTGLGWTVTNATSAADTANVVEGKKSLKLTLSGALTATQDSSINAANLVGLQGVASIKIKSSNVSGLKVCARNAGVTSTSLCVNVAADGTWKHVSIPFIMTATSNGIAITSTGTSGIVYIDDAFVGTSAPFQDVSGARLVGTVNIAGAASCSYTTSSTSFVNYTANASCPSPTITGNLKAATKIPGFIIPSGSQAGTYKIVSTAVFVKAGAVADYAYFRLHDGTNAAIGSGMSYTQTTGGGNGTLEGVFTYSTAQSSDLTIQIQGASGSASNSANIDNTTTQTNLTFAVYYFPPATKIYSQASQDTAWAPCTFPTLAWQGLGTVTNTSLQCKRKGDSLEMRGAFTTGTPTASIIQIPLPTNFGSITTATSNANDSYGPIFRNVAAQNSLYKSIATSGQGYFNMSGPIVSLTSNPATPVGGTTASGGAGDIFDLSSIKIPIQGWSDYGVIVGSFAGIEKCANDYECTDTFSANVSSTGVVTNENIDWINGNCTNSDPFVCTYNTNLKDGTSALSSEMKCHATPLVVGGYDTQLDAESSTSVSIHTRNSATGADSQQAFTLTCQKGSQDYKPKTAKVATSIGVPTVPGITTTGTGNAIDTFSFSYGTTNATTVCSASPCSYLDQIGSVVTSVTRNATGSYTPNFSKTYTKLKCVANAAVVGGGSIRVPEIIQCANCSSVTFKTLGSSGADADSSGTLLCQGSY